MRFQKPLQEPGARRAGARHHHGSDMPTSARAILHHTYQKGPNIMHPSVYDVMISCSTRKKLKDMLTNINSLLSLIVFKFPNYVGS